MSLNAESSAYTTPTKRPAFSTPSEAGPSRARPAGASPAYSSRRHSLYGIEDRIIIDPGSRVWKVGFSGEPDPRAVFWAHGEPGSMCAQMFDLDLEQIQGAEGDRSEGDRIVGIRVIRKLRDVFFKHLLTDPKSRKVIVVENTFLPTFVKNHLAQALFENLKAPSISFTPSSLLSLAACGRITGLVVDIGWLETTITPVYHSRPLYLLSRSTPLAGRVLHSRLRSLILRHATYTPPPTSLATIRDRIQTRVPIEIVTDELIERVLTEACFAGGILLTPDTDHEQRLDSSSLSLSDPPLEALEQEEKDLFMDDLRQQYQSTSNATDMLFNVHSPSDEVRGLASGTLVVPGWIRERAAEVLFPDSVTGSEEEGIPENVLKCLLKLPVDLRLPLIQSILITGGTASLPGLISRIKISILHLLLPPPSSGESITISSPSFLPSSGSPSSRHSAAVTSAYQSRVTETNKWRQSHLEPYRCLYGLAGKFAILNDPAPLDDGGSGGGSAPRWVPSLMSWVGGSLAGALKTGGPELLREEYDQIQADHAERGAAYSETLAQLPQMERDMAALVGVSLEELKPGMAIGGQERRRGWKEIAGISDWALGSGVRAG